MLSTSGVVAVVVVLFLSVFGQLLERATDSAVDRELVARADRLVATTSVDPDSGRIRVAPEGLGSGDAVLTPGGRLLAGVLDPVTRRALTQLLPQVVGRGADADDPPTGEAVTELDETDRVLARAVTVSGRRLVVLVDQPLEAYEQSEELALLAGSVLGFVAVLGAGVVAAWTTGRALRPVGRMATSARDWSRHDLDLRFGSDLRRTSTELGHLAETLDDLLDRVAEVIRGEQRLTAELAHELRTPLTGLRGTLDLLRMRDDLDDAARADLAEVHAAAERMSTTITTLLALARTSPTPTRRGTDVAALLAVAGVPADLARGDDALRVRVDPATAAGALAPLVDNARRHAASRWWVEVAADPHRAVVVVAVCDDGDGFAPGTEDDALVPGWSSVGGTGLGLPLARRLADAAGGEVAVAPRRTGAPGTRVELRLPRDRA